MREVIAKFEIDELKDGSDELLDVVEEALEETRFVIVKKNTFAKKTEYMIVADQEEMTVRKYIETLTKLHNENSLFWDQCDKHDNHRGCPFRNGVDIDVIADTWKVCSSDVMCGTCIYYDPDKRVCKGWDDEIEDINHYCVFYQPNVTAYRRSE